MNSLTKLNATIISQLELIQVNFTLSVKQYLYFGKFCISQKPIKGTPSSVVVRGHTHISLLLRVSYQDFLNWQYSIVDRNGKIFSKVI